MSTNVEGRLTKIERELDQLKAAVEGSGAKLGWMSRLIGSHKDDPGFDEIVRLGKEIRDAEEIEYES